MKTGTFTEGPNGEEPEFRKGNFSFSHEWLEDCSGLDEVLAKLDAMRLEGPDYRYLITLDDINQCSYTCGHAGQDERLYLDTSDDMDWDDEAQVAEWTLASLEHRVKQLGQPELAQSWQQVCGTLSTMGYDVDALLAANREPDQLLDDVLYIQRVPARLVPSDDLLIAAQPNGYFSADWDSFQNHAIIRHLAAQYGYRFFGMGAAWMGFVRSAPLDAAQAQQLVAELRELYGKGRDEVLEHEGWAELTAVLQQRRSLMLGYIENMAESLDMGEGD